ncbi:MAG TPA: hydroxymethylbilane synthase [Firmicutes bacterium]|jgi:hydroxymethylbilane synthase|nr:hydroxymethylbilane synthase [Bacillota bacterium]
MIKKIIVGTRGSSLALAQTRLIIAAIQEKFPQLELKPITISTSGDLILDQTLEKVGGKGLFVEEIEEALSTGFIDIAVHSMKDLPAQIGDGLVIAAVSKREDPRDALVTAAGLKLDELPAGAVIGTSSIRRETQLLERRPDLKVALLRGNVLTRLDKLMRGDFDGIILAAAGLKRLGLENQIVQYFEPDEMLPAVGQGILAIQARADEEVAYLLKSVHCEETALCAGAERAFMIRLNGDCSTPIAAYAVISGAQMTVRGMLADQEKRQIYRAVVTGGKHDAVALGEKLADMILAQMGGD